MGDLVTRKSLLTTWRKALFGLFIGGSLIVGVLLMVVGSMSTTSDNWSMVGIGLISFELIAILAGFIWIALLLMSSDRIEQHEDGSLSNP